MLTTDASDPNSCQWCGTGITHTGVCPKVKAITYGQDGRVERVEFFAPADYHQISAAMPYPFLVGASPPRNPY